MMTMILADLRSFVPEEQTVTRRCHGRGDENVLAKSFVSRVD